MRIKCNHVSQYYYSKKKELQVINDITVETDDHDFICLFGPNGCGKTTFLKIIAKIIKPTSGSVTYEDCSECSVPVSLIFQEYGLFPWIKVIDNICWPLIMRGLSKKKAYEKAASYIKKMGLTTFIHYYPEQLSTGMKQKVGLIRGLLMDSSVLLIDEAYASLDMYTKRLMQQDIHAVWNDYKKSIIYVTHDIDIALQYATKIWIMGRSPASIIKIFDLINIRASCNGQNDVDGVLMKIKKEIEQVVVSEAQEGLVM